MDSVLKYLMIAPHLFGSLFEYVVCLIRHHEQFDLQKKRGDSKSSLGGSSLIAFSGLLIKEISEHNGLVENIRSTLAMPVPSLNSEALYQ